MARVDVERRSTGYDLHELTGACCDVDALRARFAPAFLLRHSMAPVLGPQTRSRTRMLDGDEGEITSELTLRALPLWRPRRAADDDVIRIGRGAANDVTLVDETVSKLHAVCRATADGFFLSDAGSRNGTFVDEDAAPGGAIGLRLTPGQTVRFGSLSVSFVEAETVLFLARRMRELSR